MENMKDSKKLIGQKWILPIIILVSVAMACMTVLIITFRDDIKEYFAEVKDAREAKSLEENMKSRRYLQFSKEEKARLLVKQGLTSITEKQIGNVPFAWLGKSLRTPLPEWCNPVGKSYEESVLLIWKEKGYDGFYACNLKKGAIIKEYPFYKDLAIFTKNGEIKFLRFILEIDTERGPFDNTFSILRREYDALGYEYAEKFGIPIEEVYDIDKGYENNEAEAFKYDRGKAFRTYKAKEGEVQIILEHNHIKIDYSLRP